MHLRDKSIAVIGGGIGGLAAALALGRRGARVTVFEQAPTLAEVGAGLQIGPNGVAVLDALGLGDAGVLASRPSAVVLRNGRTGRSFARLPLGTAAEARYGRPYWQFHRADLLGILTAALPATGTVLRLGTRIDSVEPEAERVLVVPENAGPVPFDIVVAADGVRSRVRSVHFGGTRPRFTGHVAWRGLVPADRLDPVFIPRETTVFTGPGRHLVAYPLRGGSIVNLVAIEKRAEWAAEGWTHPDDPAAPARAFAGWCPEAEALVTALPETFLWGLFDHPVLPRWTMGRLALLGDACHPMLPFLAQGATMALEDAWVLAALLDESPEPERALAAYEDRRRPRTSRVQREAARSGRIYHLRWPAAPIAQGGMAMASRLAPGRLLARFDWLYGVDVTRQASSSTQTGTWSEGFSQPRT